MTAAMNAAGEGDEEEPRDLAAERAAKYYKKCVSRARIPERFDTTLEECTENATARLAGLELVQRLADGAKPLGRGILFWGPPGRGKSTVAVATLTEILRVVNPTRLGGDGPAHRPTLPGFYISFASLIALQKRSWQKSEAGEEAEALLDRIYCRGAAIENVKVLVLDDVGKEHSGNSDFTQNVLHDVLRSRYDAAAPTIVTTNLAPEQWLGAYGEATASFIHEAFLIVKVGGVDHRRALGGG